ncbi:hypothetical protein [Kitasatospora sp. NBC_00315]|uniref:hypothetical protein n=1 Tax=Kitasatospora sp. NBC_00315 TaxID=2975963 RepID=UPI0032461829
MTSTPDQPTFNVSAGPQANITIIAPPDPPRQYRQRRPRHPRQYPGAAPYWHRTDVIWSAAAAIAAIASAIIAWLALK